MSDLARELVAQMRSQAGREIARHSSIAELGIVTRSSPLQIKPGFTGRTGAGVKGGTYTIGQQDIVCDPEVSLAKGDVVMMVPIKGGYWYAQKVRSGTQAPRRSDGGGAQNPSGGATSDPIPPGISLPDGLPAGEAVVRVARSYKGVTESNPKVLQWCQKLGFSSVVRWCAIFTSVVYEEAGVRLGNCRTAWVDDIRNNGTPLSQPTKGCLVCRGFANSAHVNIYIEGPPANALMIGGNQGDAVTERRENISNTSGAFYAYRAPEGLVGAA